MSSTSETGHAKIAANFQDIIEFVTAYGTTYNPSKNSLKLPQLNALQATADALLADVIAKNTNYNNKVSERINAFAGLKTLATRLVNALQTTEATLETINNAKTFNRKMQGKKASALPAPHDPNSPVPETISTSQQSYDQIIQHLAGILAILETEPSYSPNEVELKTTTIQAKLADLKAKNTAVATAYASVSIARIERNETFYTSPTSLTETASEIKMYLKSVFGASGPKYLQVSGIDFSKPRL
jgi:chromosome segregation ATPase